MQDFSYVNTGKELYQDCFFHCCRKCRQRSRQCRASLHHLVTMTFGMQMQREMKGWLRWEITFQKCHLPLGDCRAIQGKKSIHVMDKALDFGSEWRALSAYTKQGLPKDRNTPSKSTRIYFGTTAPSEHNTGSAASRLLWQHTEIPGRTSCHSSVPLNWSFIPHCAEAG